MGGRELSSVNLCVSVEVVAIGWLLPGRLPLDNQLDFTCAR